MQVHERLNDRWVTVLGIAVFITMLLTLYGVFLYAPTDRNLGHVQRIFYFHVPSAWIAFLAFGIVFVASILYLVLKEAWADRLAHASAEVGVIFCTLVLLTGPIWGRPVWGVWWTWDPSLTATLVLWLIYVAYLMLRSQMPEGPSQARLAAILGIIGALDLPIIHIAVHWWRTLHPKPVVMQTKGFGGGLEPPMLQTFLVALLTFTILYVYLTVLRYRHESDKAELASVKRRLQA
ncbi:MAG: cytochrome c biogenesis protein CcsA [Candidatus Tectomicrobia bacterium]|nr:cytochrome c biogenesis protein CcsA [Candidatus Tectomicrobia bacterium]